MEVHMVAESIKFMILGMTVVFVFLTALVWLMRLQEKIINKYFPEKEIPATPPRPKISSDDEKLRTAAIIAAIAEFNKNK